MSETSLSELYSKRLITSAQYKTSIGGTNPRVSRDGELWINNKRGTRVLIDRKGKVVFDGKKLINT